ncbi:hypothetical protein ACWPKO_10735 [Coraliomargarita sp. W4R53]
MIVKLLQIMMACAIFNPFCCCTAGLLSAAEVQEMQTSPMEHSCCPSTQDAAPANSTSGTSSTSDQHDPDACPHKVLKESQATALKDGANTHFTADQIPLLLTLLQIITFEPVAQIPQRIQLATVSQAPPLALTQKYCVYRI